MAEESGVFVGTPLASDTAHARLLRRHSPDGVVASGPDAGDQLTLTANTTSQLTLGTGFALSGGWFYRTDAPVPLSVPPNGDSQPRRDLVVIRADTALGACYPHIITGTPGSTSWPSPTRSPAGTWDTVLGRYTIAGGTAVVSPGDLDLSVRQWTAPAGAIPCVSTARPPSPWDGMLITETDTGRVLVYLAGVWQVVQDTRYPGPWANIPLASGFTSYRTRPGGVGYAPRYRLVEDGNRVRLRGIVARSNGGDFTDLFYTIATMPAGFRPNEGVYHVGASTQSSAQYTQTCRWEIHPNGTLRVYLISSYAPHWLSLDGFEYDLS